MDSWFLTDPRSSALTSMHSSGLCHAHIAVDTTPAIDGCIQHYASPTRAGFGASTASTQEFGVGLWFIGNTWQQVGLNTWQQVGLLSRDGKGLLLLHASCSHEKKQGLKVCGQLHDSLFCSLVCGLVSSDSQRLTPLLKKTF
jgi:hypothetical protein